MRKVLLLGLNFCERYYTRRHKYTAQGKIAALESAGVKVANKISEIPEFLK